MEKNKTVIAVTGPTASGKTAAAIKLAQYFKTEIISADSRQCYKELNIGVARPSIDELKEVPHYFIASHTIHDKINAGTFEKYALHKADELFEKHDTILMVGGTGLYIKAFCEGLDVIPEVSPEIRQSIISGYEENGLKWLQEQIVINDPLFYDKREMQNPQRIIRALEVMKATGRSILEFQEGNKTEREFRVIKIGLEISKEELHRNINSRVDQMLEKGLVEEVKSLLPQKHLNALQTVGYAEIFDFLNGSTTLQTAIDLIKTNTRQYAKRQKTWFRKDKEINFFSPMQVNGMIEFSGCKAP